MAADTKNSFAHGLVQVGEMMSSWVLDRQAKGLGGGISR